MCCKQNSALTVIKSAASVLLMAFVLFGSVSVFAMNGDYLDYQKWFEADGVTEMPVKIENKATLCNLEGNFRYFTDSEEKAVYTCFDVCETSLTDTSNVKVVYKVVSESEKYNIVIDENGFADDSTAADNIAKEIHSFTKKENSSNGVFISAVKLCDECDSSVVDISIYINSHKYAIISGIDVIRVAPAVSVKPVKTTKAKIKTSRATAKTTSKVSKSAKTNTTKFYKDYEHTNTTSQAGNKVSTTIDNTSQGVQTQPVYSLSKTAVALYVICVIMVLVGVILIIISLLKKNDKNDKEHS